MLNDPMAHLDAEYAELMDELDAAVAERDPTRRGDRLRVVRLQIQALLREQMRYTTPAAGAQLATKPEVELATSWH